MSTNGNDLATFSFVTGQTVFDNVNCAQTYGYSRVKQANLVHKALDRVNLTSKSHHRILPTLRRRRVVL